ncbi:PH domain-containing protein [Methanothrix soehngenii]|jgi:uncharacterized membrane protein YdbT with pleckstrin-like domain|uniref:PH domain-containing protein n=1 Tax=Methanothrix soehngenii TaxID=2223 RepID=UPI002A36BB8C|nr:PH domain-containing protein [Methanothrix soehngenii]MDY0411986.1 PH domain-containing protein [Methanothrix soehngenii]
MDSYIDESLGKDECVVFRTKVHWSVLMAPLLLTVLFIFFPVGWILSVLWLIWAGLTYMGSEIGITNRRVIMKKGFFGTKTFERQLEKIERIDVSQGPFAKMLGYGSVIIWGTGQASERYQLIPAPFEFKAKVQEQINNPATVAIQGGANQAALPA